MRLESTSMDGPPDGATAAPAPDGPDRRRVLSAGAAGIVTLALPSAAAHATGGVPQDAGPAVPTGVTALPIGYPSGGATGAIRVTWTPVGGATGYEVDRTVGGLTTTVSVGPTGTTDLAGLTGADATHTVVVRAVAGSATSDDSAAVQVSPVIAVGGDVTTFEGDGASEPPLVNADGVTYVVHRFTASGTFELKRPVAAGTDLAAIEYLVVGGGGAGGSRHGGGGGAGGFVTGTVTSTAAAATAVTVGQGGIGAALPGAPTSGGDSEALGITALGGGHGSGGNAAAPASGGSGGGASYGDPPGGPDGADGLQPASPAGGSGDAGGRGLSSPAAGGGGGGAGAAGGDATAAAAGSGGAGRASIIAGGSVAYAGGGGGSGSPDVASGGGGGAGGGGPGVNNDLTNGGVGYHGAANTGGGGGAGGFVGATNFAGGDGGSGVVVLRYRLPTPSAPPA